MKGYDLVFGLPWFDKHDPHISWKVRTMYFDKPYVYGNCLTHGQPVLVHSNKHRKTKGTPPDPNQAYANVDIELVSGQAQA